MKGTYDLILGNEIEVGGIGLNLKVHDAWSQMIHVETVDDLIVLAIAWRPDVYYFPIQSSWQIGKALESNVELERCEYVSWIVSHSDIVNMKLGHL